MTLNNKVNSESINLEIEEKDELDEMIEWYFCIPGNNISNSLASKEISNLRELLKGNSKKTKKELPYSEEDEAIEWNLNIYGNISTTLADKEIKHLMELLSVENEEEIKKENVFSKQKSLLIKKRK